RLCLVLTAPLGDRPTSTTCASSVCHAPPHEPSSSPVWTRATRALCLWGTLRVLAYRLRFRCLHQRNFGCERVYSKSLGLSANVGIVLKHVFGDVPSHIPNHLITGPTFRKISYERMAIVMEAPLDICSGPRIPPSR